MTTATTKTPHAPHLSTLTATDARAIWDVITPPSSILIASHVSSDGDSLWSSFGLGELLRAQGKTVTYYTPREPSPRLHILEQTASIITQIEEIQLDSYDLIIVMDTGGRSTQLAPLYELTGGTLPPHSLLIDHHNISTVPATHRYVYPDYSSTCEVVTHLYQERINAKKISTITPAIATSLLCGMLTDTGNFLRAVWPQTLERASWLMAQGADREQLVTHFFLTNTYDEIAMLGTLLGRMQMSGGVVSVSYDTSEFDGYDIDPEQLTYLINDHLKNITQAVVSVRLGIEQDTLRVSLRSTQIDVGTMAAQLFDSGGHANAAGAKLPIKRWFADSVIDDCLAKIRMYVADHAPTPPTHHAPIWSTPPHPSHLHQQQ